MAKSLKESAYFSCRMDKTVSDQLDKYCDETGLTKTKTVEKALSSYFSEQGKVKDKDKGKSRLYE